MLCQFPMRTEGRGCSKLSLLTSASPLTIHIPTHTYIHINTPLWAILLRALKNRPGGRDLKQSKIIDGRLWCDWILLHWVWTCHLSRNGRGNTWLRISPSHAYLCGGRWISGYSAAWNEAGALCPLWCFQIRSTWAVTTWEWQLRHIWYMLCQTPS